VLRDRKTKELDKILPDSNETRNPVNPVVFIGVMNAMMEMDKIDIAELNRAYTEK